MGKLGYCEVCRANVPYIVKEELVNEEMKNQSVKYMESIGFCTHCGEEVSVSELVDLNLVKLYDAFRIKNNLISKDEICELSDRYNIGKRNMSKILGWGEHTFSRYCEGYLPKKESSDLLKKIYQNPDNFIDLLNSNKERIGNDSVIEKSLNATILYRDEYLSALNSIEVSCDYILHTCEDITPLALQKLLYYTQGFYSAFYDGPIFDEDCEAWVHGPVYKKIYFKYQDYRYDPINYEGRINKSKLSDSLKNIIDHFFYSNVNIS